MHFHIILHTTQKLGWQLFSFHCSQIWRDTFVSNVSSLKPIETANSVAWSPTKRECCVCSNTCRATDMALFTRLKAATAPTFIVILWHIKSVYWEFNIYCLYFITYVFCPQRNRSNRTLCGIVEQTECQWLLNIELLICIVIWFNMHKLTNVASFCTEKNISLGFTLLFTLCIFIYVYCWNNI